MKCIKDTVVHFVTLPQVNGRVIKHTAYYDTIQMQRAVTVY